ncbi:hypothetical protein [Streptomyces sp. NPDC048623]|uniref:hypothetical protein n=1 Tax=Streptomyces sp. NPDC048623 TaxID=3155761 RepID=UPI0034242E59
MNRHRWLAELRSIAAWWALVTGVLWLLGLLLEQRTSLAGCAATALVIIALGEAGNWARRRYTSGRTH